MSIICHTSKPKKLSSLAEVISGAGSNHSGEVPRRFLSVCVDDSVTDPVPLARITA